MSILKGLNPGVLLTEDFRKGDPATVDATEFITELDLGRKIDLGPLRAVVGESMKRFEYEPSNSDPWLGPRVHATLRLTRREAADKRIWEYLTIVEFPSYVRWRWKDLNNLEDPVPRTRFCGLNNLSAMSRLWWTAELMRNGTDYSYAEKALAISQFDYLWLGLNFTHHRAASLAAVAFLSEFSGKGANNPQVRALAKAVNLAFRTVCLDVLAESPPTDAEAVREWIGEKIDETTMMDELPKGPDEKPVPEDDIAVVRKFLDNLAVKINLTEAKAKKRGPSRKAEPVET